MGLTTCPVLVAHHLCGTYCLTGETQVLWGTCETRIRPAEPKANTLSHQHATGRQHPRCLQGLRVEAGQVPYLLNKEQVAVGLWFARRLQRSRKYISVCLQDMGKTSLKNWTEVQSHGFEAPVVSLCVVWDLVFINITQPRTCSPNTGQAAEKSPKSVEAFSPPSRQCENNKLSLF